MNLSLYVMLGYPGSGKSYVARQLSQISGATRLSQDGLRAELFEDPREHMNAADDKRLLELMNKKTAELLGAGMSVIYDANVITHHDRASAYAIASACSASVCLIWVKTPLDVSIRRNGPEQLDETFTRAYTQMVKDYENEFELPQSDERTIVIDGQDDVASQLNQILSK